MTSPRVQRGLDPARTDADLAREADRRQRAKALKLPLDADEAMIVAAEKRLRILRSAGLVARDADPLAKGCPFCGTTVRDMTPGEACCNAEADCVAAGLAEPVADCVIEAEPLPLEKDVEHAGDRLMAGYGFSIVRFSQPRASKQTPGISDRLYLHPIRRLAVFWEAKREGGRQSAAQARFQALIEACGMEYVLGGVGALRQWLTRKLETR